MTEETLKKINNLAINIFNDIEYNKFIKLLKSKEYNKLRLMVDEKNSYLQLISELQNYSSITDVQLACCNQLEDYMIDLYVTSTEKNY